ncbi:hypothetical protein BJV78DRAFT_1354240 [Lactifluus subvellereus]|nr:hypothetical protein BJV78DRAFT_1354240 [Lactifluus subvellereus]
MLVQSPAGPTRASAHGTIRPLVPPTAAVAAAASALLGGKDRPGQTKADGSGREECRSPGMAEVWQGGSEETVESEAEEEEEEQSRDEVKGPIQSTRWRDCLSECVENREGRREKRGEADHAGTFREQGAFVILEYKCPRQYMAVIQLILGLFDMEKEGSLVGSEGMRQTERKSGDVVKINDVGRWVTRKTGGEMGQSSILVVSNDAGRDKESELGRMGRTVMACKGSGEAATLNSSTREVSESVVEVEGQTADGGASQFTIWYHGRWEVSCSEHNGRPHLTELWQLAEPLSVVTDAIYTRALADLKFPDPEGHELEQLHPTKELGRRPSEKVDDPDSVLHSKPVKTTPSEMGKLDNYRSLQQRPTQKILDDRPGPDSFPLVPFLYDGSGSFMDVFCRGRGEYMQPGHEAAGLEMVVDYKMMMTDCYNKEADRREEGLRALGKILSLRGGGGNKLMAASTGTGRSDDHWHYDGPHEAASHRTKPRVVSLTPTLLCIASGCEGGDRKALHAAFSGALVLLGRIDEDAARFTRDQHTATAHDRTCRPQFSVYS